MSDHGGGSDASPSSVPSGAGQEPTIPPSKSSDRIAQSTPDSPTPDQKPVKPGDTDVNEPNTTTPLGNDSIGHATSDLTTPSQEEMPVEHLSTTTAGLFLCIFAKSHQCKNSELVKLTVVFLKKLTKKIANFRGFQSV